VKSYIPDHAGQATVVGTTTIFVLPHFCYRFVWIDDERHSQT
jgi:hypothetical protein